MNGFEFTLIYGVIVVFGILQIILFFKLWGMTNDVRRISEKIGAQPTETYSQLEKHVWQLLLENRKEDAVKFLNKNMVKDMIQEILMKEKGLFSHPNEIKNRYRKYYEKLRVPFPEQIEKINTLKDLEQLF